MNISIVGLDLIKKYEGCRLSAYKDSTGTLTIGYGHTSGVKEGQTITQAQADNYLRADVANAEKYVNKHHAHYNFNQNQYDALTSFTFNLGGGNLTKLTNSDKRTILEISEKIPAYNKAGGKVLNGLVKRRAEEQALFNKPIATTSSSGYYAPYTGKLQNLDAILKAVGLPSKYYGSVAKRRTYVIKAGIFTSYNGTYTQNIKLINLAKAGKLKVVS